MEMSPCSLPAAEDDDDDDDEAPCCAIAAMVPGAAAVLGVPLSLWVCLPACLPARLLASFPLAVGDLEWNHDAQGLVVSAAVYVDEPARGTSGLASMEATAARDKALKDGDALGGLNAVSFKRLPIRQWDSWLT